MHTIKLHTILAFILGALLFGSRFVFSFTEPTSTPPLENVSAPLNISSTGQSKAGGLILNTGGAATGLIVQNGNVGIGTLSPSQLLDVAGYIKSTGVCIGSDCRTVWPSSSSYSAGAGISISGTTITNTGVISELDPTVPSWAKSSNPSIPGSTTVGGALQTNGTVTATDINITSGPGLRCATRYESSYRTANAVCADYNEACVSVFIEDGGSRTCEANIGGGYGYVRCCRMRP